MPYITECKAPDISDLGATLLARSMIGLVSHGRVQPESPVASRLLTGYLLTTDKAVREFIAGRDTLIAYSRSSNETSLLVEGLGRYETCINATKRAFRFIEGMANHRESPDVDRTLRRLLQNWGRTLTPIRDAIEHIDGDIRAEDILLQAWHIFSQ